MMKNHPMISLILTVRIKAMTILILKYLRFSMESSQALKK